jgi:hypothetical protein
VREREILSFGEAERRRKRKETENKERMIGRIIKNESRHNGKI